MNWNVNACHGVISIHIRIPSSRLMSVFHQGNSWLHAARKRAREGDCIHLVIKEDTFKDTVDQYRIKACHGRSGNFGGSRV